MTPREEIEQIITEFLLNLNINYFVPLELAHDELLAKLIQEEKKATRYKNKYQELRGGIGDDGNYRQMCQKLIKERDMYKKMYLEEKNRK
ncbi:MAG: hypothetical protein RR585_01770 [Coprobacillus sp.]